ncbi:hypothetical protein ACFY2V_08120 [Streptomyces eurythermus]|uniref:hypothetical protein n=1 Tax=Streptomyces eurythermus TaxID=42237 RepID=UPI0036B97C9F
MTGHHKITIRDSGQADSKGTLSIANTGVIEGDINISLPSTSVSGYLHQVEAIAATGFRGRETELHDLADFCKQDTECNENTRTYWRWLAPAWAGKSALMAHFVLNPPEGIDIVSFFITARFAGQSDRVAFCEVVQRQIYALLGEEQPLTTPATRDEQLRLALNRAAHFSSSKGRRLVLVIDGLDEDRGVTAGAESYSIAALLPRKPQHGMRIIVAGRPHPPVPDDVLAGHPLRDPSIDHWLKISPHAEVIRHEAERDLLRLLDSEGLGRELVGFVASAGGGLSASDLAALTGSRTRLVERELSAVSGRSFRKRASNSAARSAAAAGNPAAAVYLLAHEELQVHALNLLSHGEISAYKERLHSWADTYRDAGWPPNTPVYLLRGYVHLLLGDYEHERLLALASDRARHERLWHATGSDLEALNEIDAAFEHGMKKFAKSESISIHTFVALALARDAILDRTANLPLSLITLWAHLGDVDRSINLANAQEFGHKRSMALTAVAEALAQLDRPKEALEIAYSLSRLEDSSSDLAAISRVLASRGFIKHAEVITSMTMKAPDLLTVQLAVARHRYLLHGIIPSDDFFAACLDIVETVTDPYRHATILAAIAGTLVTVGQTQNGMQVVASAVTFAQSVDEGYRTAQSIAGVAITLATIKVLPETCRALALRAAQVAESLTDPDERSWAVGTVASALVKSGQNSRAVQLCLELLEDMEEQGEAVATVAMRIAESGEHEFTLSTIVKNFAILDDIDAARTLAAVATSLAKAGEVERTLEIVDNVLQRASHLPEKWNIEVRVSAAWAVYHTGRRDEARKLAISITDAARSHVDHYSLVRKLSSLAKELRETRGEAQYSALLGYTAALVKTSPLAFSKVRNLVSVAKASRDDAAVEALEYAVNISTNELAPTERCEAFAVIAEGAADIGNAPLASRAASIATELLQRSNKFHQKSWDTVSAVQALSAAGDFSLARELANSLMNSDGHPEALDAVASGMARCGQIAQAFEVAQDIPEGANRTHAFRSIICASISAGARNEVLQLVDDSEATRTTQLIFAELAGVHAADGDMVRSLEILNRIDDQSIRGEGLGKIAAAIGASSQGNRYLAEALSLTRWDSLLPAISGLAPAALDFMAEYMLDIYAGGR